MGADVQQANKDGETPLWIASKEGHLEVVRVLVEKGANNDGKTPSMIAQQRHHTRLVKCLSHERLFLALREVWAMGLTQLHHHRVRRYG